MKKHVLLLIAFFATQQTLLSQNLVPNPSFENYTTCPQTLSQFNTLQDWQVPFNHFGTSDNFNVCAPTVAITVASVPHNFSGYQYPATGDAYIGLITFVPGREYREYAQVQLLSPLIANKTYEVSFKVNLSNNSNWASNGLGICFTPNPIVGSGNILGDAIIRNPQVRMNYVLVDTIYWKVVKQYFVAQGGEQYLTMGNFSNDINTIGIETGVNFWDGSCHYLIDDVSVELCATSTCGCAPIFPNAFTPNNDGRNDIFQPIGNCLFSKYSLQIFNRWGQQVFLSNSPDIGWDGSFKNKTCILGTYFYILRYSDKENNERKKQGNVILIR